MKENNTTIEYYNQNAAQYFNNTVNTNMSECCDKFLKYIVSGGKIIDIGAGSGRDIKYFKDRGYEVEGIDASEEMCRLASDYTGINIKCQRIQDWYPKEKYDGIWANASILHLSFNKIEDFVCRSSEYLNTNGIIYISMKSGIKTGLDKYGRFFTSFSDEKAKQIIKKSKVYKTVESWITEDRLGRNDIVWMNLILKRKT